MSKELYQWSQDAGSNGFASADGGMAEGMARNEVNDSARERMRALREFYEDPTWLRLAKEEFTVSYIGATGFLIQQTTGGPTSAVAKFPVGCRLRFTDDDVTFGYGHVLTVAYTAPFTTVTMNMDTGSAIPAGVTDVATHVSRDVRGAAFVNTGTGAAEVPLNSDLGTAAYKTEGADGTIDADLLDGLHAAGIIAQAVNSPNLLLNPGVSVWQRGTNFTAATTGVWKNDDDTVLADGWGLLSETNDLVDVSQDTADFPPGAGSSILCTSSVVPSNDKWGFIQILEGVDSRKLAGQEVIFSCYVKANAIDAVRMSIIFWDTTPDTGAMDVVDTWNAQKANPTPISNWNSLLTPSDLVVTTDWTQISVTGTLTSTVNNVAVFVWTEANHAASDLFRVGAFDFYLGNTVRPFRDPDFASELAKCQRRFWKSFDYATAPAQSVAVDPLSENDPGEQRLNMHFPVPMFNAPANTVTTYAPAAATANWSDAVVPTGVSATQRKLVIGATAAPAAGSTTIHATVERRFA